MVLKQSKQQRKEKKKIKKKRNYFEKNNFKSLKFGLATISYNEIFVTVTSVIVRKSTNRSRHYKLSEKKKKNFLNFMNV